MAHSIAIALVCVFAGTAFGQVLHSNGDIGALKTGGVTRGGLAAPPGFEWSESGDDGEYFSVTAGLLARYPTSSVADDFRVPASQTWHITGLELVTYQNSALSPTIELVTVQVYDQLPGNGVLPIYGSHSTNVFVSAEMADVYRITSHLRPDLSCSTTPDLTRRLQKVSATVELELGAGMYWIEWSFGGASSLQGPWSPYTVIKPLGTGVSSPLANGATRNGMEHGIAMTGVRRVPPGTSTCQSADPRRVDFPFTLLGTKVVTECEPDLTTGAIAGQPGYGVPDGFLNNDDFFYYLSQFAAGNLAVADLTTTAIPGSPGYGIPNGIINNDDFFYYLSIFSAGC